MPDQLTEARDQIAEMCGWMQQQYATPRLDVEGGVYASRQRWFMCGCIFCGGDDDHPIPASLDFVSRATSGHWQYALFPYGIYGTDHNERLLVAFTTWAMYLRNLRDHDRPAFDAACEKIRKEVQG